MGDGDVVGRRLAVLDGIIAHPATIPSPLRDHVGALRAALPQLERESARIEVWAHHLAAVLGEGGRLLVAGSGAGAHQAAQLCAQVVGRYRRDRNPYSAIALTADPARMAAPGGDHPDEPLARQVRAHGRAGDVLLLLSATGRNPGLVAAAEAARETGMVVWALTGPSPNPITERADDAIGIVGEPATVLEVHQVAVHLICDALEAEVGSAR